MYEERREKFSFKGFFLTLLLVLLFIFLMLWLFPTKNYVDKKLDSTYDLERLSVLYDEIFANNVGRMKDAAIGYFTNERMPQKVGETKKLTLQEMYDLHLVLKMKDKDGNPCDAQKSYVEMTKYTEEYRLKVNLSCGKQEDYIIVYLGCYNYCNGGICEKRVPTPNPSTKKEEEKEPKEEKITCKVKDGIYYDKAGNKVSEAEYKKSCNIPIEKKYLYEYKKVVDDSTTWGPWSNWDKTPVKATDLVKVETKVVNEHTGNKTIDVPVKKTEKVKKQVAERFVSKYITELVLTGTKDVQIGTTDKKVTKEVKVGTVQKKTGKIITDIPSKKPKDTDTKVYKFVSADTKRSCSYCEDETYYTWEEYSIEPVYDVVTTTEKVPVYKTINVYETKEVPVYDYRMVEKEEEVEKTVIEKKEIPVYSDVTYYRFKTASVKKGYTDIKWSNSQKDSSLIDKGYKLTGNVKEA